MQPPEVDFDPFSDKVRADAYPYYAQLRDRAPVFTTTLDGQRVYGLTRHRDVATALSDHARHSAADGLGLHPAQDWTGRVMVACDPPDHTRIRQALGHHLAPGAINQWRRHVQQLADTLIPR
jgi:cytochrome P450